MITVDILRALVVISLAMTAHFMTLQLWHLALASVGISVLSTFFDPSLQASIPELTKESGTLSSMNALMITNHRLARTVGPGLAGFLVAALPIHHFFSLDAVTFLASALAVASISRHYEWKTPVVDPERTTVASIFSDIAGAAKVVLAHQELSWTFGIYFVATLAWSAAYIVGFPLWIKQVIGGNVGTYGILLASYGVGGILSNVIVGTFTTKRRMLFVSISQLTYCIGFLVIASTHSLVIACVSAAFAASGGPVGDIVLVAMMQSEMPPGSLGRIFSFRNFVFSLSGGIGLLIAPWIFTTFSAPVGLAICAMGLGVSGVAGLLKFGGRVSKVREQSVA